MIAHARSHAGSWGQFREEFVLTASSRRRWRRRRSASRRGVATDDGAESFQLAEARQPVATAERFVAAVERLIA